MPDKNFQAWIALKEKLHFSNALPKINENEIWWCSCGENIGIEINGKHELFSRPVFIYKKLSRFGFIGIPLTSKNKKGPWYVSFSFQDKRETAVLSQIRTFSVSRLSNRMGKIGKKDAERVRASVKKFLK